MMSLNGILPAYPGYALGSIISEAEFLLPIHLKRQSDLNAELERKTNSYNEQLNAPAGVGDEILDTLPLEMTRVKNDLRSLNIKIQDCYRKISASDVQFALPLDDRYVKLSSDDRAFRMERLNHIIFDNNEKVHSRLESFVAGLFLQDAPRSFLSTGALEGIEKSISSSVTQVAARVTIVVVGSFITLESQRRIDPLVIRPNASLDATLLAHAAEYYVLKEAVLGAVFIGVGRRIETQVSGEDKGGAQVQTEKLLSTFTTVSFVSQGAIPKLDRRIENVNLWSAYVDWKETLLSDPKRSGYPIGFKVQNLKNVLEENNRLPKETQ